MAFLLSVTLKTGEFLEQQFADRVTAEAEARCIERWRQANLDLPTIPWTTTDGKKWVLSADCIVSPPVISEVAPAETVAG